MIHLAGLSKRYGAQELFHDVAVQLPSTGVVGLVGPNGAGKSTLFRIIAGQESPDAGEVRVPRGTRLGWLTQDIETAGAGSVVQTVLAGFADVLAMEERMVELAERAADPAQTDAALAAMADLQAAFDAADGFRLEERARTILDGLGFSQEAMDLPYTAQSGGWRMRTILARLLLEQPDVLMLDEPTNHLDIDAIYWLEGFLARYPGLVLLISHDRELLDRGTDWTLAIFDQRVKLYRGNYSAFEDASELERAQVEQAAATQARERKETEEFIARFRAKASKAKQVQSRIKALEKQEVIEPLARRRRKMTIRLVPPNQAPRVLIECSGVKKAYGENVLFSGFDWRLQRGEKVAVVGPNGVGKTTFLRLLAGQVAVDAGEIRVAPRAEVSYFAQHHLEALEPQKTVFETLAGAHPNVPQAEVRAILGAFLFSGPTVDKKVDVLSGGERARLSLARIFLRPRNLLLLDEPTNHLDMESREVVSSALSAYEGTLIVVSHDRAFINGFVNHVVALHPGEFVTYPGNMDAYHWKQQQDQAKLAAEAKATPAPAPTAKAPAQGEGPRGGELRRQKRELQTRYRNVGRRIAELEEATAAARTRLADPAIADDHQALWDTQKELDAHRADMDAAMADWESLIADGTKIGVDLLGEGGEA